MRWFVFKLLVFVLLISILAGFNAYIVSGPLLQHNTELSMRQFDGVPATAGDFEVGGYWVSYNSVYLAQAFFLGFVGFMMFISDITRACSGWSRVKE